ncbi:DUF1631 domain-containing protein [Allohahella marinimesophila]|uniref:DUF1631 domain-containing protein n=1 Tax=Allohahella marinimesophila TaxID=1054972 RepID=A0ABP7Q5F0_9GAMM
MITGPDMSPSEKPGQALFRDQHTAVHASLLDLARDRFSALLARMFDGTDDSFFELANHAHTNNEQNRFFEAMREIRIRRRVIEAEFLAELEAELNAPGHYQEDLRAAADEIDMDTLSLVQNDALEESVAITTMVTKARANFAGELLNFQARVSSLYVHASAQNPVNPLDPDFIARTFLEVCHRSDLAMEIRERLILLKQFDREVLSFIGGILEDGNRLLAAAGILPNLKLGVQKSANSAGEAGTQSARPAAAAQNDSSAANAAEALAAQQQGEALFSQLQTLMASIRNKSGEAAENGGRAAPRDNVHYIADRQLFGALSNLQEQISERPLDDTQVLAVDMRASLDRFLASQHKDGPPPALSQADEDLINLVSMLFEFILQDYNLSAPVQVLISRLQIPILKVAIRDKAFFSKPSHPARKLLNSVAKAGIGWSDFSERRRDKLYEEIHSIVDRILNDYDGDMTLFQTLNDEFDAFRAREDRKASLVEQRTRESEVGRVKAQRAHRVVERLLQAKMEGGDLPDSAIRLLRNGWSQVMFLAFLKEESEHRFNQTVRVVDELTWCLQSRINRAGRERWVKIVPQLLKNLKSGLQDVSYDPAETEQLIIELKRDLTAHFKLASASTQPGDQDDVVGAPRSAVLSADIEAAKNAVERQAEMEDAALIEYLNRVDQLSPGAWVEYSLVNGSQFRCKLSTTIEETGTMIFVNRLGLKVVEKSRAEVAHELRRGRVKFLQEGMLVDRAMDAVMSNLRKISGKAA